jgi:WD40 repeat protein
MEPMVSASQTAVKEPYIGPQPFKEADEIIFFGRNAESQDLFSLIVAHGEVLLYAQSGAGKTSLLNAGVIPRLKRRGLMVRPPARVSGEIPSSLKLSHIQNIYIFSALRHWAATDVALDVLASQSLSDFLGLPPRIKDADGLELAKSARGDRPPEVLIFDQLEEMFERYPERRSEPDNFFKQIGEALSRAPHLRVVFAIREDFIAQLRPYVSLMPERLKTQFRLERLREANALEAVTGPLTRLSDPRRHFADGVAEKLIQDLALVRVKDSEGNLKEVPGDYVEPVQLAVVCDTLWQNLPQNVQEITEQHLKAFGDVGDALSKFYEGCLKKTAAVPGVTEARLRRWFGEVLITSEGTRGTVYRSQERTAGMPNAAVDILEKLHLIRQEQRAGGVWYELSHDRFVAPIQESNRQWLASRGSAVETKARLEAKAEAWIAAGKPNDKLLGGSELSKAEDWVNSTEADELGYSAGVTALVNQSRVEQEHREVKRAEAIAEAQRLQAEEQRKRAEAEVLRAEEQRLRTQEKAREARRFRTLAVVAGVVAVIAVIVTAYALRQRRQSLAHERAAKSSRAAAMSTLALVDGRPDLALLLAGEAINISPTAEARRILQRSVTWNPYLIGYFRRSETVSETVVNSYFSPDDPTMLVRSCSKFEESADRRFCTSFTMRRWDLKTQRPVGSPLMQEVPDLNTVVFSRDGKLLAIAGCTRLVGATSQQTCKQSTIGLWDAATWQPLGDSFRVNSTTDARVTGLDFGPNDRSLVSAVVDGSIIVWDTAGRRQVRTLPALPGSRCGGSAIGEERACAAMGVAFSQDGRTLISISENGFARLWHSSTWQLVGPAKKVTDLNVLGFRLSPKGSTLAVLVRGGPPFLSHLENGKTLLGPTALAVRANEKVLGLGITADGQTVATAGCLEPDSPRASMKMAFPSTHAVKSELASDCQGQGNIRLWNGSDGSHVRELGILGSPVTSVSLNWSGDQLTSIGEDGSLILWATTSGQDLTETKASPDMLRPSGIEGAPAVQSSPDKVTYRDVNISPWLDRACHIANRNLTPKEWHQYFSDEPYRKTCLD